MNYKEEHKQIQSENELYVKKLADMFSLMVQHNIESYRDGDMEIKRESLKMVQEKNADLHRTKQAVRK